jgi:spore germination protein YaaH
MEINNRRILLVFLLFTAISGNAQVSIHQEQSSYYNQLAITANAYDTINQPAPVAPVLRGGCTLDKVVYGWHPYWSNGVQSNYQWNLLSHFCYFSYEVDANTGNALSTHSFSTTQSVTDALNNGLKVTLCVTLFSNHATFLGNATSRQTLITNLINLIQARGAHGVNIDFEGIPSSQSANFTLFMNDLSSQFHAAIPGSEVSTVLYAVDWNAVIDAGAMPNVDMFIIMGYDYYWSGSANSGPNDPLFHFGSTYNYTLSKSITYYLDIGVPANKLILGLPYYGREWPVTAQTVPSSTTGSGVARTLAYVKNNASGYYAAPNKGYDAASMSTWYSFNNGGWRHCFITEKNDMSERLDLIRKRGIGGMGIWALGYDDGYNDFWDEIYEHMTDCAASACNDSLFDIGGGPLKNYYNDEDYTYTVAPPNATSLQVSFTSFDLENNFDYLYIYDGPSTVSPPIAGSPFTGTVSPGTFTTSSGSVTFRFVSDGSTTAQGWNATYTCLTDMIAPVTSIAVNGNWQTQNFTVNFTDTDNLGGSGVNQSFFQVLDFDSLEWRGNGQYGFFNDNFNTAIHAEWTTQTGPWSIVSAHANMSDENEQNSNLFASVIQQNSYSYLYHWQMNMGGSGTNRRAGIHFFCDDAALPNRGNSYFVYYRVDSDKCQIYKVVNDVFTLMTDDDVTVNPATWYNCKVTYDPSTGTIKAYLNNVLVSSWADSSPFTTGSYISLRSGGTDVLYDDVKVYRSRTAAETITVGNTAAMVRYQNYGVLTPSCSINSIINDMAANWSVPGTLDVNIDWTTPTVAGNLFDGAPGDIDTSYNFTQFEANFTTASDPNSDIDSYEYSLGISPGDSSVVNWTSNGISNSILHTGINLDTGIFYYVNVRAQNGAGLTGLHISSDGFMVLAFSGIENQRNEYILVYPVPASEYIMVQPTTGLVNIFIYDSTGRQIYYQTNLHTGIRINVSNWPSGVYQLIAESGNGKKLVKKIMVE